MHAALSAARLATAVVGIIRNCPFESTNMNDISVNDIRQISDKKMHTAITSAAALVVASCAEAAKSAGASREQVSSVINMGLDATEMGDLLTLTTSTAACLRGVECLKMRTIRNYGLQNHKNSQKGAILPVRTPEGRLHNRMVSVDCNYDDDNVMLTLRKGHPLSTSKKYIIFCDQGEQKDLGYQSDEHGYQTINLSTSSGTIQLLFEEDGQYSSWKSFINYLILSKARNISH
ncbi:hypothetical protein PR202_ga02343 [Eleusine coracana subsp. coracana]|uniref:VAN3-binding protein-like auxin canalisation domain-containing protein n=1 Tax=Eleusine coracana subsp. coracana TaxID=191504 RepID=A0AAV5BL50_ELECO|nr:hypothetical protein PR202_ga02343 [Eleusine coracana subsp. coracana]